MRYAAVGMALAFSLLTVGCTTNSGVQAYGSDGAYFITLQEKVIPIPSGAELRAKINRQASEFCASSGKKLEVISESSFDMAVMSSDPRAEIHFKCAAKN